MLSKPWSTMLPTEGHENDPMGPTPTMNAASTPTALIVYDEDRSVLIIGSVRHGVHLQLVALR